MASHPIRSTFIYRFGVFQVDLRSRELRKSGIPLRLQGKPFQLLIELLRRAGEVVSREELQRQLWTDGTFVDFDEGLNSTVKRLRVALGDSSQTPVYIETISGYGYRFIAPVVEVAPEPQPPLRPTLIFAPERFPQAHLNSSPKRTRLGRRPWVWYSLALVTAAAVASLMLWLRTLSTASLPIQAIAVLPLENLSGDTTQEYLADGITDEITTALARLSGPKVISRTSAMQYKGTHKSVPEIAHELNVGAVVEGSFARSGDRVRVRVQLIRGSTDQHLWADEYDRNLSDVLALEADVAQDIAEHIQLQLSERQRQDLARNRPINAQAFQDYLQGRHYWALRTKESLNKAVEFFNRAIQEDPNDARSYAGLAHCYIVMPMLTGLPQAEGFERAHEAAAKALALDDSLPEAHLAVAESLLYHDWGFVDAEKEFERTLQLNPNYSTGHQWYAEFLGLLGRHDEAIREVRQALALDPLSAIIHHQTANILRNAGHYDEAIEQYRETLKISPAFHISYWEMSGAYWEQGKIAESIQSLQMGLALVDDYHLDPRIVSAVNGLPAAYTTGGKRGYLRQRLKVHRYGVAPHYYLARDYAQLGDQDTALAELTRSFESHDLEFLWILTDHDLAPLRDDPRFQRLIRATGFPQ